MPVDLKLEWWWRKAWRQHKKEWGLYPDQMLTADEMLAAYPWSSDVTFPPEFRGGGEGHDGARVSDDTPGGHADGACGPHQTAEAAPG